MNELRKLILTLPDHHVLALNAYFEARSEFRAQGEPAYVAVMAVVLNRVFHPTEFDASIQEVVAARRQFSWTNHGDGINDPQYPHALKMAKEPGRSWDRLWQAAKDVAQRVLQGTVRNPVANATYYFNPQVVNPFWADDMEVICDIGQHRFLAAPGDPEVLWPCALVRE